LRLGDGPSLGVAPRGNRFPAAVPQTLRLGGLVHCCELRFLVTSFVVRGDDLRERLSSLALLDVQQFPFSEP